MLRSKVPLHLLAPTATDGGGGADVADPMLESDPSAVTGWMSNLPSLDPAQPAPKKETDDGKATPKPSGSDNAGVSPNAAKSGEPATDPKPPAGDDKGGASGSDATADKQKEVDSAKDEGKKDEGTVEKPAEDPWPRKASDWERYKKARAETEAKLKKEIDAREEKLKTIETEMAQLRETATKAPEESPTVKAEMESLRKENAEMHKQLMLTDVTKDPRFQSHFGGRVQEQMQIAGEILGEEKLGRFKEIMALPAGEVKKTQLEEFLSDLGPVDREDLSTVRANLRQIENDRRKAIADAESLKQTQDTENKTKADNQLKAKNTLIEHTVAELQKNHPAFQPVEGDAAWNEGVKKRIEAGKKLLTGEGLTPVDIVKAAFNAASMPTILETYKAHMAEKDAAIAKLEAQVKSMTAAVPKPAAGGSAAEGTGTAPAPKANIHAGQTPQEASDAFFKSLGSL